MDRYLAMIADLHQLGHKETVRYASPSPYVGLHPLC